jgi:hypothetical protein
MAGAPFPASPIPFVASRVPAALPAQVQRLAREPQEPILVNLRRLNVRTATAVRVVCKLRLPICRVMRTKRKEIGKMGKYVIAWLLGVPGIVLVIVYILFH